MGPRQIPVGLQKQLIHCQMIFLPQQHIAFCRLNMKRSIEQYVNQVRYPLNVEAVKHEAHYQMLYVGQRILELYLILVLKFG